MKKHLVSAILLILIAFQLSGQKTKDVLYLNNGSKIYGKLIEVNAGLYKIQTSDGSIFIYSVADVEKFVKETPYFDGRKTSGFSFMLEAGLLAGAQNTDYFAPFSFNVLGGLTKSTKHITSIGTGVEFIGRSYTPLFLEYRYIIRDRKTSPFLFLRGGAVIPLSGEKTESLTTNYYDNGPKNYKGGASLTMGTGISWAKEDYETYLSFAYRYAHTSYNQQEYGHGIVTYVTSLHRLEIKFGFKF